ncbi:MAG: translation initiation factor IF-2 subunit alpha [Candidatus Bathyarchaeia archaeon]
MDEATTPQPLELPEVGDLVIATVVRIADYGAYVTLDEYKNMDGLLHISEVSSSWVKNIRNFVREKQKVVLKVLRVDIQRKQVDLSLRRVSGKEKQDKLLEWKRRQKAFSIVENVLHQLKVEDPSAVGEVLSTLEEKYDDPYAGLEDLAERGEEALEKLKLPKPWSTALLKVAQQKVKLPTVEIKGILELTCPASNGVNVLKKVLTEAKTLKKGRKVRTDIYTVGAPRYAVEIKAKEYKTAEKVISEMADHVIREIEKAGGTGKLIRQQ